jgi:hypothetical protein
MTTSGTTSIEKQTLQYNDFCKYVLLDTSLAQCTKSFNYKTTREIQDEYGLACSKIFKLMYVMYQRGGRTFKGRPYRSLWVQDKDNIAVFQDLHHKHKGQLITGKQMLQLMEEKGCVAKERVKFWDDLFDTYEAHIFGGSDLVEAKRIKKLIANREGYVEIKKRRESLR